MATVTLDPPMMYHADFLKLLEKHNKEYREKSPDLPPQWSINCIGHIRACHGACPITHVYDMERGRFSGGESWYPPDDWSEAAAIMGMPSDKAKEVMMAADASDGHDVDLRKQILAACNLVDKAYFHRHAFTFTEEKNDGDQ